MDTLQRHKSRMAKLKKYKATAHIKEIATAEEADQFLHDGIDHDFLQKNNVAEAYSRRIDNFDLKVSDLEVNEFITSLEKEASADNILEPVFLGLLDGTMRAFKIGTKQGLTASRLYGECKTFNYEGHKNSTVLDSHTEYLNEQENISEFDKQSKYNNGELSRNNEDTIQMRDGKKMGQAKEDHFGDAMKSKDGYNPDEEIYSNKTHAKSQGKKEQAAETDHVVPCVEICNQLKSNKALNPQDIKEIININDNLLVTSQKNNRGSKTGKFGKNEAKLREELDQGYVEDDNKKQTPLSDSDKEARSNMVDKMANAKGKIDSKTNEKVMSNVLKDNKTQQRLASDAGSAAGHQAIGDLVLSLIKPLYYELQDCFQNGIEEGVNANNFKSALKIRFNRMKNHIVDNAAGTLGGGALGFFKNFLTMLLEGIVNCFVGIFKHIARMIKEGIKILFQILPVLKDKATSAAQKGDAILKLIISSVTIFAGIGIETWLNSLGLGEPWSIIVASILSAVLTSLMMYLLSKIDLFGVNRDLKIKRVSEALSMNIEDSEGGIKNSIMPLMA